MPTGPLRRRILDVAIVAATAAELAPTGGATAGPAPEAGPAAPPVRQVRTDSSGWRMGAGLMDRILLVEDEALIAELVGETLTEHGHQVEVVNAGKDALKRLDEEPRRFGVLVTDIDLGDGVTGFDVARKARAMNGAIQIVYVTGLPANIHAAEPEALMFLKPFDLDELALQVDLLAGRTSTPEDAAQGAQAPLQSRPEDPRRNGSASRRRAS